MKRNAMIDFLQAASNSVASNVSAPVDGINWIAKTLGLPASNAPFMGSDWMAQRGLTRPVQQGAVNVLGETAGMLAPMAIAAKAPQIARGLLQAEANAMAPQILRKESGMFIGPGAKTWDATAASKAQQLAAKGVEPRAIWSETGTWKGPDGMWRQEIPDNAASLKNNPLPRREIDGKLYEDFRMSDALSHNALYEAYPDAMGISGSFKTSGTNGAAYNGALDGISFDKGLKQGIPSIDQIAEKNAADAALNAHISSPRNKRLDALLEANMDKPSEFDRIFNRYGGDAIERNTSRLAGASNKVRAEILENPAGGSYIGGTDGKSVTLHELQHAIQQREGWARGGSPESMKSLVNDRQKLADSFERAKAQFMSEKDPIAKQNALQEMSFYGLKLGKTPKVTSAEDAYMKLAGEAEARATQARMPLDAAQRRALFPEDSYDVPLNQLIVRGMTR